MYFWHYYILNSQCRNLTENLKYSNPTFLIILGTRELLVKILQWVIVVWACLSIWHILIAAHHLNIFQISIVRYMSTVDNWYSCFTDINTSTVSGFFWMRCFSFFCVSQMSQLLLFCERTCMAKFDENSFCKWSRPSRKSPTRRNLSYKVNKIR